MDPNTEGNTILVQGGIDNSKNQSPPKNQRPEGQSSGSISLQIEGTKGSDDGKDTMKGVQTLNTLLNPTFGSSSVPPKFLSKADQAKMKLAYKANSGELLGDKEDRGGQGCRPTATSRGKSWLRLQVHAWLSSSSMKENACILQPHGHR
jgi:hypothetical protein